MEQELGRLPTAEEVAEKIDVDLDQLEWIMQASARPISLDQPVGEDNESELGDFITSELAGDSADAHRRRLLSEDMEQALARLPSREARILSLRFGLRGDRRHTLKEVGEELGLTRERIRQIQNAALQRLRYTDDLHALSDYLT
jgi:RNA polymerase primary sigma factor